MIVMLKRFPVRMLLVLLLIASFLQYVRLDQYGVSIAVLLAAIFKYFASIAILGIAGVCVINIFIKRGVTASATNPLVRFLRSYPIVSVILIAGIYAVIATAEGYFGTHVGISPFLLFAVTISSKAFGALCMALIALCLREHLKSE